MSLELNLVKSGYTTEEIANMSMIDKLQRLVMSDPKANAKGSSIIKNYYQIGNVSEDDAIGLILNLVS